MIGFRQGEANIALNVRVGQLKQLPGGCLLLCLHGAVNFLARCRLQRLGAANGKPAGRGKYAADQQQNGQRGCQQDGAHAGAFSIQPRIIHRFFQCGLRGLHPGKRGLVLFFMGIVLTQQGTR